MCKNTWKQGFDVRPRLSPLYSSIAFDFFFFFITTATDDISFVLQHAQNYWYTFTQFQRASYNRLQYQVHTYCTEKQKKDNLSCFLSRGTDKRTDDVTPNKTLMMIHSFIHSLSQHTSFSLLFHISFVVITKPRNRIMPMRQRIIQASLLLLLVGLASSFQTERRKPLVRNAIRMAATLVDTNGDLSVETSNQVAHVAFVSGSAPSGYGMTSPEPEPKWSSVASQLALRLPNFSGTTSDGSDLIKARSIKASSLETRDLDNVDIVIALGISTYAEERRLLEAFEGVSPKAVLVDPSCSSQILNARSAGPYKASSAIDDIVSRVAPWSRVASGKRLLGKVDTLLARKSSEDYIFAILFCINALVTKIDVVKSDINPSWEKGLIRNVQEFATMTNCCGPQISAALSDPKTKNAIDLLNAVDLRDQVGSYRVIVSNETPQLEEFTLCILQQNNCFNCDSPILERPNVPLLNNWRGKPLDDEAARQIFIGHLDHPDAHTCSKLFNWSWKIVVGANPAYDAFPMQHQIFYPSGGAGKSLWYDPVFCVETLDGELVWCKRHYRCTPRKKGPGAWTLTTLDNGMVSEEKWTTVDAADDLSWAVFHYSGAARRAGQSYVGALLCTPDGSWPSSAKSGEGLERIRNAFRKCDLELWELFGGSTEKSYMWSDRFTSWAKHNPPPLDRIGDISITTWRKQEREKAINTQ